MAAQRAARKQLHGILIKKFASSPTGLRAKGEQGKSKERGKRRALLALRPWFWLHGEAPGGQGLVATHCVGTLRFTLVFSLPAGFAGQFRKGTCDRSKRPRACPVEFHVGFEAHFE